MVDGRSTIDKLKIKRAKEKVKTMTAVERREYLVSLEEELKKDKRTWWQNLVCAMTGKWRHEPKEKGTLGKPYADWEGFTLDWLIPTEHTGVIVPELEYG